MLTVIENLLLWSIQFYLEEECRGIVDFTLSFCMSYEHPALFYFLSLLTPTLCFIYPYCNCIHNPVNYINEEHY